MSNPVNLNKSKGNELIMKWTQEIQESHIKSQWNHYFDEVIWTFQIFYRKY